VDFFVCVDCTAPNAGALTNRQIMPSTTMESRRPARGCPATIEWPDVKKPWIGEISILIDTTQAREIVTFALNHREHAVSKLFRVKILP
jgi:hypothetical protein